MIKQKHLASTSVRYFRQFTLILFLFLINTFQSALAQEETKSGNIEYLKNTVNDSYNGLIWLSNEKWGTHFQWKIEWSVDDLEVNLNNREPPTALIGETEILQKYVLVETFH